jgi:hypothetical protein
MQHEDLELLPDNAVPPESFSITEGIQYHATIAVLCRVRVGRCESGFGNDHRERLSSYKGKTQGHFYKCRHYGSR